MAVDPILLPDGSGAITNWDADVIEVTGAAGQPVRVARAAAPPVLQQAVQQAEQGMGGPQTLVRAPESPSPFGNIDIDTPGPGVKLPGPSTRVPQPTAPQAPADPAPAPVAGGQASPLAAVDAEIARLRAQPQVAYSGGGTRTATSTTRMPAAAQAEVRDMQTPIDESVAEQQLAVEEQGASEEKALANVSQLHAQQGRRIEQEVNDQASLKQSYEQRYAAEERKLAELSQRAQVDVDPKRYWKNKDTGDKILATIGVALGAFVEGFSRGAVQNRPLQMLQTAIERDIDAQLENRNRAERDVGRQAGFVGLVGDKYSDDLQKRQAALVLANEAVAKQIDGIAAGMQSEQAKAKAMQLSAQLREANARQVQAFTAQIAGSETVQTQQVPDGVVQSAASKRADALSEAAYGPGAKFSHDTYIPASVAVTGEARSANSKEDAVDLNKKMAGVQEIIRKTERIEEIAKNGKLSPQAKRDVASLRASLALDVKNAEGAGALDAGTLEIVNDILGPTQTDITTISNTLPRVRESLRAGARAAMRNRTHLIDPTTVPLAARQRVGSGAAAAPPPTRPLAVEGEP